ncbi:MAG TPA: alpha/beta hydrolase [Dehalococcoidia bacterium]|jgi:pimeloyl-ACP methyl ester carboxylesterase|nr:alpha/beta hydrolase [Dehalococcoidia bacterium]
MPVRTVAVNGGQFQTEVIEEGSGAPLLYLHGVQGVQDAEPFLTRLGRQRRVIAPRHPGFGESTGSEHLQDIHDLIYYYLDFLDATGLRDLPIAGHSLGGMIAAELAAVQPERFSHLVLIAPFGLWNPDHPVADFFSMTPRELAQATYHDPGSPAAQAAAQAPEEHEAYVNFMLDRAKSLATTAKYIWPIPNKGLSKRLHRISVPTLLVWGASDRIVPPQYVDDFKAGIRNAKAEIIQHAGHLPQAEQPERLAEVVLDFVAAKR